jgi:hypothetical protein
LATSIYSEYAPDGPIDWDFYCSKLADPENSESGVAMHSTITALSGSSVPQLLIDDLHAAGWRVMVSKIRPYSAVLDTSVPE